MSPFGARTGATTDEGSSMYEMEEPRPAQRPQPADSSAAGCPACCRLPGHHRPGYPPEDPVSRFPAVSEASPGSVSAFGGVCVSTPLPWDRTRLFAHVHKII